MSTTTEKPATNEVTIEIDGQSMSAPKGSMIIHAADKAGIAIPRFCYHDKLPIAANCRMCLVDVEKAPKPMPACATPVMEGMKVYTQSKRALDSQRNVMEFLLINHPLDCPICDQGGECELQDVAMGYGRSVSRFNEGKRVVADEDIGPLVATDMTRCIHCTRCVRFVSEISGTYELGGMGRGENLSIGTYIGKNIGSELSGNIIDICPVGALTNKPFRYRARAWELISRESIGYHDGLGSNLYMHVRRGEVLRCVPRDNEALNESWLSDRDRYSHTGLNAADRVTSPMLRKGGEWQDVSWEDALARVAELLTAQPGDQLGMLVHPSTSIEEGALLKRLADAIGCANIDHRLFAQDFSDQPVPPLFEASLEDVEAADQVLLLGCNPRHEAPILGHRVRKAWKRGASISAINPIDFDFHFELAHGVTVLPGAMVDRALGLARALSEDSTATPPAGLAAALGSAEVSDELKAMAQSLKGSDRCVVILGETALNHPQASWLRVLARFIADLLGGKLNCLPQGANAIGLTEFGVLPGVGGAGLDAAAQLSNPRQAYLLYGIEPEFDFARPAQAQAALAGASHVVAFAAFASESLKSLAEVILPIGLLPEIDGSLVNALGYTQLTTAGAKLPGEARAGWRVLRVLGGQMNAAGFDFNDVATLRASLAPQPSVSGSGLAERQQSSEGLERIELTPIYRSDAVVRRAAPLQAHSLTRSASITLNPSDAERLGCTEGTVMKISDSSGTATLPLEISPRVPPGGALIERAIAATAPLAPLGSILQVERS